MTMAMVCAVTIVIVIAIVVVAITPLLNEKYRSCIEEVFTGNSFFSNYNLKWLGCIVHEIMATIVTINTR